MAEHESVPPAIQYEELTSDSSPDTVALARNLLLEYGHFVVAQVNAAQFCFGSLEKEAAMLPSLYHEQGGGCLLAYLEQQPAGFVAWRALQTTATVKSDAWEMKRLWVRTSARGLGLGRALSEAILERAIAARRRAVYLDTVPGCMAAAHRLYLNLGFTPCSPYNDNRIDGIAHLVKIL